MLEMSGRLLPDEVVLLQHPGHLVTLLLQVVRPGPGL